MQRSANPDRGGRPPKYDAVERLFECPRVQRVENFRGLEAINLAREEQPDLILMDIRLPGISGFDVTRLLKQDNQTKAIPIIAVTAFATQGDETTARESGCAAYITKPVNVDELLRTIEFFLSS